MRVAWDHQTDERGFRERVVGEVVARTDTSGPPDHLTLIRVESVYAYHPMNQLGGRFLPTRGHLIAADTKELEDA